MKEFKLEKYSCEHGVPQYFTLINIFKVFHVACKSNCTIELAAAAEKFKIASVSIIDSIKGRKNWLFSDKTRGAKVSAIANSVIESVKVNQLNPYMYLVYLLSKLPKELTQESLAPYLPWSPKLLSWCH
jgi:hypothetical protein